MPCLIILYVQNPRLDFKMLKSCYIFVYLWLFFFFNPGECIFCLSIGSVKKIRITIFQLVNLRKHLNIQTALSLLYEYFPVFQTLAGRAQRSYLVP